MRMSELAARAEVPVATVKYYLREGLLPAGRVTGPRRAEYDESHLRRLRILWMLREVGQVPVAALRRILDAAEDESHDAHHALCRIADALTPELPEPAPDEEATTRVDAVLEGVGWTEVRPDSAARVRLAAILRLLANEEWPLWVEPSALDYYAELIDGLARTEVGLVDGAKERSVTLIDMAAGEAVFGQVLILLRRMAHEHLHASGIRPQ